MKLLAQGVLSVFLVLSSLGAVAGTNECYGYTSTTNHFPCLYPTGNCTWWAAYMRPDIAEVITGSGWDGGNWINKLNGMIPVGSVPGVGAIVEFDGHVAFVTNVLDGGAFRVSEMDATGKLGNGLQYATYYPGSSNTYHRNTDRGSDVKGSWILKGFIYAEDPAIIPGNQFSIRHVGNYGWYPAYSSCIHAESWYGFNNDKKIVRIYRYSNHNPCQWIYETLYPKEVSYNALFGNANACYQ
ncbi:MAG: CHAP domain-containing protein [Candidatus Moraniibacteriota bacterium]|nr:MAG: CHAP domain-containing protein [Candidatus Moranbacteria bacterium]